MKDQTKKSDITTPTTKEAVVQKLRDLSLEDLDSVIGGIAAGCDNNVGSSLN